MDKVRKQIRDIDAKMIAMIGKRMELSEKLGKIKKEKNLPVRNLKREKSLFLEWQEIALICDVSPTLVKKLWKIILSESINKQK